MTKDTKVQRLDSHRQGKIETFFKLLPSEKMSKIFEKLNLNRPQKREFSKLKTDVEKRKWLYYTSLRRRVLIEAAYTLIREEFPLDLKTASYDEIFSFFQEKRKIQPETSFWKDQDIVFDTVIFFARWCSEKGQDGTMNTKYFAEFVDSQDFSDFIKEMIREKLKEGKIPNVSYLGILTGEEYLEEMDRNASNTKAFIDQSMLPTMETNKLREMFDLEPIAEEEDEEETDYENDTVLGIPTPEELVELYKEAEAEATTDEEEDVVADEKFPASQEDIVKMMVEAFAGPAKPSNESKKSKKTSEKTTSRKKSKTKEEPQEKSDTEAVPENVKNIESPDQNDINEAEPKTVETAEMVPIKDEKETVVSLEPKKEVETTKKKAKKGAYNDGIFEMFGLSSVKKEKQTMKLLGLLEKRITFYNFIPQFEVTPSGLKELLSNDLKTRYPTNGCINLSYSYGAASGKHLAKFDSDIKVEDMLSNRIYVLDFDEKELEENKHDVYKVKLDVQKVFFKKNKLKDLITPAYEFGIYKVVTSEAEPIPQSTFLKGNIYLKEKTLAENEPVLLHYDSKYYGPFPVKHRIIDDKFYISINAADGNCLVPYYAEDNTSEIEIEWQFYLKEPSYMRVLPIQSEPAWVDMITDDILIEKIKEDINFDLAKENPEEFIHMCANSPFLSDVSNQVLASRTQRIFDIIDKVGQYQSTKQEIFDKLLEGYRTIPSDMSNKLIKESDLYKDISAKYNEERRKSEEKDKQMQKLQEMNADLNLQIEKITKQTTGTASEGEISLLNAKIVALQEALKKAQQGSDVSENVKKLQQQQEKLIHTNEFLTEQSKEYQSRVETARNEVRDAIRESASQMGHLAFEPYIASEMMKAAASWDAQQEDKKYKEKQHAFALVPASDLSGSDLVNYIVEKVQERRNYSRNDIVNIFTSVAQNFITIFSGEPGTGKTSMCNIIAETLGLHSFGDDLYRYSSVSVERGWASKKDLIGYFNPLTRKYDKSGNKIYDALKLLDAERDSSEFPFLILLDEANLSPIEYYWADFMRLTDRTSKNDSFINIGTDKDLYVPQTLRFVATVNTDQTTESLSPRLIDRASIIRLPKATIKDDVSLNDCNEKISWENFVKAFARGTELRPITQKALSDIYTLFEDYGMNVSPRIRLNIENYVKATQETMEDEADVLRREKALDFAIVQKLLPKINGYYTNYARFFDSLNQLCKEHNLKMTEKSVAKIVENQERNMGYCQYLI